MNNSINKTKYLICYYWIVIWQFSVIIIQQQASMLSAQNLLLLVLAYVAVGLTAFGNYTNAFDCEFVYDDPGAILGACLFVAMCVLNFTRSGQRTKTC